MELTKEELKELLEGLKNVVTEKFTDLKKAVEENSVDLGKVPVEAGQKVLEPLPNTATKVYLWSTRRSTIDVEVYDNKDKKDPDGNNESVTMEPQSPTVLGANHDDPINELLFVGLDGGSGGSAEILYCSIYKRI